MLFSTKAFRIQIFPLQLSNFFFFFLIWFFFPYSFYTVIHQESKNRTFFEFYKTFAKNKSNVKNLITFFIWKTHPNNERERESKNR